MLRASVFVFETTLHLIDLSRRLEQDVNEDAADYVLFRLQQASNHFSRLAASVDLDVFNGVQTRWYTALVPKNVPRIRV